MTRSILFWILALLITLASAYYQRTTGPTYPVDGTVSVHGADVHYSLTRTHGGDGDQPVSLLDPSGTVTGEIVFRRYKSPDDWSRRALTRNGDTLRGWLPHQPPAGKIEYFVELDDGSGVDRLPAHESVVTRFKGAVPLGVLIPHVIAMFLAMLLSTRAGIESFRRKGKPRRQAIWATGLLIIGGLILGPIVQKYAFGAYWTGFPFGTDLTDNKTLIAFIAWAIALVAIWKADAIERHPVRRWLVAIAALVTLAVYLIPHSMMGSELDYSKLDAERARQHPAVMDSVTLEPAVMEEPAQVEDPAVVPPPSVNPSDDAIPEDKQRNGSKK
ncbi:MAG: hypothetical protein IH600_06575 [Bacteroidetes bacterium]|nr:hypothetical protein [Bacteroidota bacterium]